MPVRFCATLGRWRVVPVGAAASRWAAGCGCPLLTASAGRPHRRRGALPGPGDVGRAPHGGAAAWTLQRVVYPRGDRSKEMP